MGSLQLLLWAGNTSSWFTTGFLCIINHPCHHESLMSWSFFVHHWSKAQAWLTLKQIISTHHSIPLTALHKSYQVPAATNSHGMPWKEALQTGCVGLVADVGLGERVGNRGETERWLMAEGTGCSGIDGKNKQGWGQWVGVRGGGLGVGLQKKSLEGTWKDKSKQMPAGYWNRCWKPKKFTSFLSSLLSFSPSSQQTHIIGSQSDMVL